ncbi:hypothetical protein GPECTOR_61g778 [Gonium pectorale]|uniref:Protein kinase domain-containing protein n=1 Tax=Gonium pectorale TaxID=33097 RepID=A0A150G5L3_GONPE|nr:hypothetical protein GPECTOR_61g778 [Gonium pectorale]|eukprot:KXZ44825.1 hypothetical protein GPECTOR_61g778 [Gonium pectorale]
MVHLFKDKKTGELVAIKLLERTERRNTYLEGELLNHRLLNYHPHVVQFREVFLTSEHICIVMEYASAGCLFDYVTRHGRLRETEARWFFQQLVLALDYCHRCGVVNRDVKLENTLLHPTPGLALPLVKICDFGYSKSAFESLPKTRVGTVPYMAPEVVTAAEGAPYDGAAADAWSCGVMLYAMLFGAYPFDEPRGAAAVPGAPQQDPGSRERAMLKRIVRVEWSVPPAGAVSDACRDLLCRLLVGDPRLRLSMAQIQQHPWFLANLPAGAASMNDKFLAGPDPEGVQSEDDIRSVLDAAVLQPAINRQWIASITTTTNNNNNKNNNNNSNNSNTINNNNNNNNSNIDARHTDRRVRSSTSSSTGQQQGR